MKRGLVAAAILSIVLVSGALGYGVLRTPTYVRYAGSVKPGMTERQVFELLGEPTERAGRRWSYSQGPGSGWLDVYFSDERVVRKTSSRADGKRFPGKPDKYASAHDFRRSFGERWAKMVMPAVLQRMMRHKSILTTMRYYATGDAHALAQSIWATGKKAG